MWAPQSDYDVCKGVEEMVKKMHDLLFTHVKNFVNQVFIDAEDCDLQHGHDEELHRAGFTQDGTKGDKDCGCAEVCIDYSAGTGDKAKYEMVRRQRVQSKDNGFHYCRKWQSYL